MSKNYHFCFFFLLGLLTLNLSKSFASDESYSCENELLLFNGGVTSHCIFDSSVACIKYLKSQVRGDYRCDGDLLTYKEGVASNSIFSSNSNCVQYLTTHVKGDHRCDGDLLLNKEMNVEAMFSSSYNCVNYLNANFDNNYL